VYSSKMPMKALRMIAGFVQELGYYFLHGNPSPGKSIPKDLSLCGKRFGNNGDFKDYHI
jgi:hypothetical protein